MSRTGASRPSFLRTWLIWTAGFLAFPIAGLAGTAVAGRVASPFAALLGGAVTGPVIGAGQAVASRRRLDPRRWIPATAIGMGLGLLLGAAVVDYQTSLADLALMGALTGLVPGWSAWTTSTYRRPPNTRTPGIAPTTPRPRRGNSGADGVNSSPSVRALAVRHRVHRPVTQATGAAYSRLTCDFAGWSSRPPILELADQFLLLGVHAQHRRPVARCSMTWALR